MSSNKNPIANGIMLMFLDLILIPNNESLASSFDAAHFLIQTART